MWGDTNGVGLGTTLPVISDTSGVRPNGASGPVVLDLRGVAMPFFMLCDVAILPGEIFRVTHCLVCNSGCSRPEAARARKWRPQFPGSPRATDTSPVYAPETSLGNLLIGFVVVCVRQLSTDPGAAGLASGGRSPDGLGTPSGACGYGDFGRTLNDGIVATVALDIRISCEYLGHNIKIKIHESSRYPDYLAILIIYKGGKSQITAVELLQGKQWKAMRNAYGAVWDLPNPPKGIWCSEVDSSVEYNS
ncbi:hypothetical protein Sjap_004598 [Stephania japonica]|uniref:Expansin-like CBD domain-containing protein n=1 Tax=Stephania japonica TaxID=461633 RepID=A0AAP0K3I9_9MAGN